MLDFCISYLYICKYIHTRKSILWNEEQIIAINRNITRTYVTCDQASELSQNILFRYKDININRKLSTTYVTDIREHVRKPDKAAYKIACMSAFYALYFNGFR